MACAPSDSNIVYGLFQGLYTNNCAFIQRYDASTNTWANKSVPTIVDQGSYPNFTRGQAWYDLIASVDPNNANVLYIGGVDALRSTDSANTWTQMTAWSLFNTPGFTAAQNVHADQHNIVYAPGSSSRAVWATDGGVSYTANANVAAGTKATFVSKNNGYNVTQYYSCAMHPTNANYFLAGSQDNGTQKFTAAGLNNVTSATSGDGGFCHIDQNNPNVQITSYVYNNYFISTDGGATFADRFFNSNGSFINPTDYDDNSQILYAGNLVNAFSSINTYLRWNDPATAGYSFTNVSVPQFAGSQVTNVTVSPLTPNRVYFGLAGGSIVRVDNANTGTAKTGVVVGGSFTFGSISSVAIDPSNEDHMLVTVSNYGIVSVFESKNATQSTATFKAVEGNLPDMPVRWAMFDPRNSDWALLATEIGVWSTNDLNGSSTDWQPTNSGFANVRVDMLQYRPGDRTIAAATHGRGLFTAVVPNITTPDINFSSAVGSGVEQSTATNGCRSYKDYVVQMTIANAPVGDATATINIQSGSTAVQGVDFDITTNGDFVSPANTIVFSNGSTASKTINIRIYNDAELEGAESFKLNYTLSGTTNALKGTGFQTYAFAINDNDFAPVSDGTGSFTVLGGTNGNTYTTSPFRSDKLKHKVQNFYTTAELNNAGFLGGGSITALSLNIVSPNARTFNSFTVSLANSTTPNLNVGFVNAAFTQVFTGNYTTLPAGQFNTPTANQINFTTPFTWDGVSNIIVQYCFDGGPNLGGTQYYVESNSVPLGTGIRTSAFSDYTSGSTSGCSLPVALLDDNRPKITFTGSFSGTPVASTLNTAKTEYLTSNNDLYFYAPSGEILARVKNLTTQNYGCTQVVVDRAGTGASPFTDNNPSNFLMNKTFRILSTTNNPSGQYEATFYFTKAEVDGWVAATGQSFNNIMIVKVNGQISDDHSNDNSIQVIPPTRGTLGTKYFLTATFNTGFSGFGFGVPGAMPLPLTLLNFGGKLQSEHAILEWATSSETNTKAFEIEKSFDGFTYRKLASVAATGNSRSIHTYDFTDKEIALDRNYYRLNMIDLDNKTRFSDVVLLKNPKSNQGIRVINNPFINYIDVRFAKVPTNKVLLQLTDLSGKRIQQMEYSGLTQTVLRFNVQSSALGKGIYMLTAFADGASYTLKVMKN